MFAVNEANFLLSSLLPWYHAAAVQCKMQIFVQYFTGHQRGHQFVLNVEPDDTVLEAKEQIEDKQGIPLEFQKLICAGILLEVDRSGVFL